MKAKAIKIGITDAQSVEIKNLIAAAFERGNLPECHALANYRDSLVMLDFSTAKYWKSFCERNYGVKFAA